MAFDIDKNGVAAQRTKGQRSVWVHPTLPLRHKYGEYHRLVQELKLDGAKFKVYFRLITQQFEDLLSMVGPSITKMETNYRETISPAQRLCIYIGDSYHPIAFNYKIGHSTVAVIVQSVSRSIWDCLVPQFMPTPAAEDWKEIVEDFHRLWAFRNCCVAIYGKHVIIQAPIVLLAVVDSHWRFRVVDVGAFDRSSDGGTLQGEQRAFNIRLSHARKTVECAFGILTTQWRLYRRIIGVSPGVAEDVVKATCILHNFLRWKASDEEVNECQANVPAEAQPAIQHLLRMGSNSASREALSLRATYITYFSLPAGAVPWQYTAV
uniref:Zgc:194221 n=1 Tax=Sinocyclocheilus rhinocerous TaxID=307959 RepID=A0A673H1W4_9TELE